MEHGVLSASARAVVLALVGIACSQLHRGAWLDVEQAGGAEEAPPIEEMILDIHQTLDSWESKDGLAEVAHTEVVPEVSDEGPPETPEVGDVVTDVTPEFVCPAGQCCRVGDPCDDPNKCSVKPTCEEVEGKLQCVGKVFKDCDDYDESTVDTCDPATGKCLHTPG